MNQAYYPQRPLRFRAYHYPTSEMFEVFCFTPTHAYKNRGTSDDLSLTEVEPYLVSECALMQLTGVRDKTGAEVWEGDVLRWDKLASDYPAMKPAPDYSSYWRVTFYQGCFCSLPVGERDPALADRMDFSEYARGSLDDTVVGNVYQHRYLWEAVGERPLKEY